MTQMTFGQWLKTERIKRNQSQDELAASTGYTQAAISKAERGLVVSREFCHALARAWGLDEAVTLTAAGYEQAASDEADELAARIRRLGERDRALLLALIGAMEK
jgi:transcriptional regulator with XRE-family HTH domain